MKLTTTSRNSLGIERLFESAQSFSEEMCCIIASIVHTDVHVPLNTRAGYQGC